MSTGNVYKQAIKRVFAEKYHDERMAVYWGQGRHHSGNYLFETLRSSAIANGDRLGFVISVGNSVTVKLTDDERRELLV